MCDLRHLPDFDLSGAKFHDHLPLGPNGGLFGVLPNGMRYYINKTTKPKNRASVRLAVNVGSVLETDEERGVAHILEHLAFSATAENINHQVIQKLRSIGCDFGPCSNAYTAVEETVYEFLVPTDEPDYLTQILSIVSQFAFKIRCAPEDLEKERGPVLEEWRCMRQSGNRAGQALWKLMHQGSKYADRMPIGIETVIRGVSADTVKAFYKKWYHPAHMAVIVVGDFADLSGVLENVEAALGYTGVDSPPRPLIPDVSWVPHSEPRCHVFIDREAQSPTISVLFKHARIPISTPEGCLSKIKEDMLHAILNRRLNNHCREANSPAYAAQMSTEPLVRHCSAHNITVLPLPGAIVQSLEMVLVELARLRVHGAADRELDLAKAQYLSEYEQLYQERNQTHSEDLAAEYVRHFTQQELVIGPEAEARLTKTLLKRVTLADTLAVAKGMLSTQSCIIKVEHHCRAVAESQLLEVVKSVDAMEASGMIPEHEEELPPEQLLEEEPEPGEVVSSEELPNLGATQLTLSNGMVVVFRQSDLQQDQILLTGFAAGGLSEHRSRQTRSNAAIACTLAEEMGMFGFKPSVFQDIVVGKRVAMSTSFSAFWRHVSAEVSPLDIDVGMQMVHKLFTNQVVAVQNDLAATLQIVREQVLAQLRDPLRAFKDRVRVLNYGNSACLKPLTAADVARVDVHAACGHYTRAFWNPAEFTLCFVGNINESEFLELAKRYLASIPPADEPRPIPPENVTQLDIRFPERPIRAKIPVHMIEPTAHVQVTFPVQEAHWLAAVCKLLEHRLTQRLRFEWGSIYSVCVSHSFGFEAPSRRKTLRGDIAVEFSCSPDTGADLGDAVLSEVKALQEDGPTEEEVASALTLEQRAHELNLESNAWWLASLAGAYQSRQRKDLGGPDNVFKAEQAARVRMRNDASRQEFRNALRRLLPWPCMRRYTIVTTVQATLLRTIVSVASQCTPWILGALVFGAFWMWHGRRNAK